MQYKPPLVLLFYVLSAAIAHLCVCVYIMPTSIPHTTVVTGIEYRRTVCARDTIIECKGIVVHTHTRAARKDTAMSLYTYMYTPLLSSSFLQHEFALVPI